MPRTEAQWLGELEADIRSVRGELPLLPRAAIQALHLAQQPNVDLQDVLSIAEQDPALAARFMAVANSALYYRGIPITSLRLAMVRLGAATVKDILYMAVLTSALKGNNIVRGPIADVFRHSVMTARACRLVAEETQIDSDLCFLGGLLHDIGKVRCLRILGPRLKSQPDLVVALRAIEQVHTRAGSSLARTWKLPEELIVAIEEHHQLPDDLLSRNLSLGGVIAIGDALAYSVTEKKSVSLAHPKWNIWVNQLSFDLGRVDAYLSPPVSAVQAC